MPSKAQSSFNGYDLEDLLPRWLQNAYTTPHIQSALTALDEREDARSSFRAESAKAAAATEAISSHLHNSDPNTESSESTKFYSIVSGISPDNMRRNRYMDVLPYDRTRVQVKVPHFRDSGALFNEDEESEGLYLNANWVQEKYGRKWWIASQAPLRNTAYTFLSLLLEDMYPPKLHSHASHHSRPRTVVQLTQNIESGRRKAHPYFPDVVGQTMIVVPDFTDYPSSSSSTSHLQRSKLKVTLVAQERIGEACCVKSLVEVRPFVDHATSKNTTPAAIRFTHLLFNAWPDHSVPSPSDRAALFEFVRLVDRVNRQMPSGSSSERDLDPDPPIIVGCSAGIGRTGSFIAMNSLLRHAGFLPPPGYSTTSESHSAAPQQLTQSPSIPSGPATPSEPSATSLTTPLGPLPTTLSTDLVSQEIDSLREQRAGMVQRPEQAVLVYEMMVGAYVERGELKR
ncbi:protein-tyrosine phosphatase-like protein [Lentinula detonsa]|uniref:Protein-tyrosine phosphatase-like protein n=1 Tax=Lentinula detonsa TaxID=2804962 RepID=A0A9W8U2I0_9AGAR|nr:protein-tyrosine phosphatase-like protein [Lentinula detonsa]